MPDCSASRKGSERGVPRATSKTSGQPILNLFEKITGVFRAQIQKKKRRTGLLKHGIQSIGHADVAHLRERAQKRLDAPDEVRVLRVEDANRGRIHAAAISCLNRTSGSKI